MQRSIAPSTLPWSACALVGQLFNPVVVFRANAMTPFIRTMHINIRPTGARSLSSQARDIASPAHYLGTCLTIVALSMVASTAWSSEYDSSAVIQAGDGDRAVKTVALGYTHSFAPVDRTASPWSYYGEAVIGEWFVHRPASGDRTAFTQLTASPVIRYEFGQFITHVFVEVGVGLSAIVPHFRDNQRRFSTAFNFDDHASLGYRFGENELSLRVEHFSNGGIKNPNPGQNFGQLRYGRHF